MGSEPFIYLLILMISVLEMMKVRAERKSLIMGNSYWLNCYCSILPFGLKSFQPYTTCSHYLAWTYYCEFLQSCRHRQQRLSPSDGSVDDQSHDGLMVSISVNLNTILFFCLLNLVIQIDVSIVPLVPLLWSLFLLSFIAASSHSRSRTKSNGRHPTNTDSDSVTIVW